MTIDQDTMKASRRRVTYSQMIEEKLDDLLSSQAANQNALSEIKVNQAKSEANQTRLEASQMALSISFAKFEASLPTRQEQAAQYVSIATYQALEKRLDKVEKNLEQAPQHGLAKWALWIAAIGTAANILISTHLFGH